jgi:DNA-binding PadR family transcriptional regulator
MYKDNTKIRVIEFLQKAGAVTYNKVQYLGMDKKQIHHKQLYPLLKDLETEGKIEMIQYTIGNRISRIIKWKQ